MIIIVAFNIISAQYLKPAIQAGIRFKNNVYFCINPKTQIDVYSLEEKKWTNPIIITHDSVTAFHIDSNFLYIAYDRALYRYSHDGGNELHLRNCTSGIFTIKSDDSLLFVFYYNGIEVISSSGRFITETTEYNYKNMAYTSLSIDKSANSVYCQIRDIAKMTYDSTGKKLTFIENNSKIEIPYTQRTWLFPGNDMLVTDRGSVVSCKNLTFINSFGVSISDIDFLKPDIPVVLSGNQILLCSNKFLKQGYQELPNTPDKMCIINNEAVLFAQSYGTPASIVVNTVKLDEFKKDQPVPVVNPEKLPFSPDEIFLNKTTLFLYSQKHASIFRWDVQSQKWTSTIPLFENPIAIAFSASKDLAYITHKKTYICKLQTGSPMQAEQPFVNLRDTCGGLLCTDDFLIANEAGMSVFDAEGRFIDNQHYIKTGTYGLKRASWNENARHFYYFDLNSIYWTEIGVDGKVGLVDQTRSFSSGELSKSFPIKIRPDGLIVLLGDGSMYDSRTFYKKAKLTSSLDDAVWINGTLYTMGYEGITRWENPEYKKGPSTGKFDGVNLRLLATNNNNLIAVYKNVDSIPVIAIYDTLLKSVNPGITHNQNRTAIERDEAVQSEMMVFDILGRTIFRGKQHDCILGSYRPRAATGCFLLMNKRQNQTDIKETKPRVYFTQILK